MQNFMRPHAGTFLTELHQKTGAGTLCAHTCAQKPFQTFRASKAAPKMGITANPRMHTATAEARDQMWTCSGNAKPVWADYPRPL